MRLLIVAGPLPAIHQAQPLIWRPPGQGPPTCSVRPRQSPSAPQPLIWSSKPKIRSPTAPELLRELPSMVLWRTDEIAPVILLILVELMVLGRINYTIPI
jgi:hypothetical protein